VHRAEQRGALLASLDRLVPVTRLLVRLAARRLHRCFRNCQAHCDPCARWWHRGAHEQELSGRADVARGAVRL